MNRKLIIYLAFVGLISLFSSCEKDGTKVVMSTNPTAPSIVTLPSLTLQRAHGSDTLVFVGTPVDPGFTASATYFLEAAAAGTNFAEPIAIMSGVHDNEMKIIASTLNGILLDKFPADQASSIDFRIRAVLAVDAGTGAPGTSSDPLEYISAVKNADVTIYGPPTLAFTSAGKLQGITSPTDNKQYAGWIYTDGTPFQLTNKDNGKVYGGTVGDLGTGVLTENGPALELAAGAYDVTVDLTNANNIVITVKDVTIGIIGDAVGGWDNDTKMIFDFSDRTWNINKAVVAGGIKFRSHGVWNSVNVAYRPNDHDLNDLYQSHGLLNGVVLEDDLGDSQNIDDIAPGNYNVKLFLETTPMKVVFAPAK